MIDKRELRIGNLVWYEESTFIHEVVVTDIMEDGINHLSWNLNDLDYELLQPIPITEEWLFELGFHQTISFFIEIRYRVHLKITWHDVNKWHAFLLDALGSVCVLNDLAYVHQLQNLFYCLSGKELLLQEQ